MKKFRTGDERGKERTQGVPKRATHEAIPWTFFLTYKVEKSMQMRKSPALYKGTGELFFFLSFFKDALTIILSLHFLHFSLSLSRNTNYAYASTKWSVLKYLKGSQTVRLVESGNIRFFWLPFKIDRFLSLLFV